MCVRLQKRIIIYSKCPYLIPGSSQGLLFEIKAFLSKPSLLDSIVAKRAKL